MNIFNSSFLENNTERIRRLYHCFIEVKRPLLCTNGIFFFFKQGAEQEDHLKQLFGYFLSHLNFIT